MFSINTRSKALAITALVAGVSSTLGCSGSAQAQASRWQSAAATPAVTAASIGGGITDGIDLGDTGSAYEDGYLLGQRNGTILVNRLKQRTTDLHGCSAVGQLESALLKVSRSVKPAQDGPQDGNDELVAGFYSGYLRSVRKALATVRHDCGATEYDNGAFAGELFGAVACQVTTLSATAITSVELDPLYDGWSGGSSDVQSTCRTTLLATIESCTSGADLIATINATVQVSCSDTSSWLL